MAGKIDVPRYEEKYSRFVGFVEQHNNQLGTLLKQFIPPQMFALLMFRASEDLYPHYIAVLERTEQGNPSDEEVERRSVQLAMDLCADARKFLSDTQTAAALAKILQYFLEFYELLCQETITSMRRKAARTKSPQQQLQHQPPQHQSDVNDAQPSSTTTMSPAEAATVRSSSPPSSASGSVPQIVFEINQLTAPQGLTPP